MTREELFEFSSGTSIGLADWAVCIEKAWVNVDEKRRMRRKRVVVYLSRWRMFICAPCCWAGDRIIVEDASPPLTA